MKRWIPWVLTLGFVGFLVLTTDLDAFAAALERADWGALIGLMAVVAIVAWLVDSATLKVLFDRFLARVSYKDVVVIKGVSYFLNAVNYSLAAAGMAWYIHKKKGVGFLEAFSTLVWFFFVDIIALGLMLGVGWWLGRDLLGGAEFVERVPIVLAVIGAVVAGSLVYWNGRFDFFIFGFFRNWRIFETFKRTRLIDYPKMIVLRGAFICVYVWMHWVLLPTFGVEIDFDTLLMYAPLITFVQVVPANISGLGAVQTVLVGLFSPHVPATLGNAEAVIFAYSTVIGPLLSVMRFVIGYLFVQNVSRELIPTADQVAAAREPRESDTT